MVRQSAFSRLLFILIKEGLRMEVLDQLNEFFRQYFGIGLIAAVEDDLLSEVEEQA